MTEFQLMTNSINANAGLPNAILVLLMGIVFLGLGIYALLTGKVIGNGFVEFWRDSLFGFIVGLVIQLGIGVFLIYRGIILLP